MSFPLLASARVSHRNTERLFRAATVAASGRTDATPLLRYPRLCVAMLSTPFHNCGDVFRHTQTSVGCGIYPRPFLPIDATSGGVKPAPTCLLARICYRIYANEH